MTEKSVVSKLEFRKIAKMSSRLFLVSGQKA